MDVVCVGNLVADAVPSPIDRLPAAGELKLMERYLLSVGGCAANTAVSLRRLGRSVRVVGKVGQDLFGEFVLGDLERLGVETTSISRSATHQTSATLMVNVRGEDRRFIHCIGANADFTLAEVAPGLLDGARVLYLGGYLAMPRFGPDDLAALFAHAKQQGLLTVLDVVIPAGADADLSRVERALRHADAFLPNDDEARALTGQTDPFAQAQALARLNPACTVVITCGSHGLVAARNGRLWRMGNYRVDSIDASGSGDAFDAGFIAGLLENWPLERALRFASAVGASATRALGCTAGVFTMDEALAFIAQNNVGIDEMRDPAAAGT